MRAKHSLYYASFVVILVGLPLLIWLRQTGLLVVWPHFVWENEPIHSTVEAIGALLAITLAIMLLWRGEDEGGWEFFPVAMGLLSMGILDGFHAVSLTGQGFVLLHSAAGLAGGFGLALVWLTKSPSDAPRNKWILWAVVAASIWFGIGVFVFPETFPRMIENGKFTPVAININIISGLLFLAAAVHFLIDFHRSGRIEPYLFACLAMFFGLSGLTFMSSELWNDEWWFWHVLRLVAYLFVVGVVVRDYRRMVSDLSVSRKELDNIFQTAADGMRVIDKDFNMLRVNDTFVSLSGVSRDESVGKRCYEILSCLLCHTPDCPMERVLGGEERVEIETEKHRRDGRKVFCLLTATAFRGPGGGLAGIVEDIRDITERKKIEKMKETLIRDVTHSLKDPIVTAKMAYAEVERAVNSNNPEEAEEFHEIVRENIDKAQKDIGNILALYSITETGVLAPEQAVSLRMITEEVVEETKRTIQNNKIDLKIDIPEEADKVMIREREMHVLLSNILDNAVKFTNEGSITVSAGTAGDMVRIEIKDTGRGIADKEQDRVFDKFYQRHPAVPGVGLGLSICKEIVERYNGSIKVVSRGEGRGTTVIISLPKG